MDFIDSYAYSNHLRKVEPVFKAGLAGSILILCLLLNSPFVGLAAVLWMAGLAVWLASIPPKVFGGILLAEFGFFLLATGGIAVSITLTSPVAIHPWRLHIGPVWFSTAPQLLRQALLVISRVMGCVAAMNFLALTTPMTDLFRLAQQMRMPDTLIDLMTLMYRYIFVLFETMERMLKAQQGRLGYATFKSGITSAGLLATRLFLDAYRRSQQLQIALEARGYESGNLRLLTDSYGADYRLLWLGLAAVASLLLVWMMG